MPPSSLEQENPQPSNVTELDLSQANAHEYMRDLQNRVDKLDDPASAQNGYSTQRAETYEQRLRQLEGIDPSKEFDARLDQLAKDFSLLEKERALFETAMKNTGAALENPQDSSLSKSEPEGDTNQTNLTKTIDDLRANYEQRIANNPTLIDDIEEERKHLPSISRSERITTMDSDTFAQHVQESVRNHEESLRYQRINGQFNDIVDLRQKLQNDELSQTPKRLSEAEKFHIDTRLDDIALRIARERPEIDRVEQSISEQLERLNNGSLKELNMASDERSNHLDSERTALNTVQTIQNFQEERMRDDPTLQVKHEMAERSRIASLDTEEYRKAIAPLSAEERLSIQGERIDRQYHQMVHANSIITNAENNQRTPTSEELNTREEIHDRIAIQVAKEKSDIAGYQASLNENASPSEDAPETDYKQAHLSAFREQQGMINSLKEFQEQRFSAKPELAQEGQSMSQQSADDRQPRENETVEAYTQRLYTDIMQKETGQNVSRLSQERELSREMQALDKQRVDDYAATMQSNRESNMIKLGVEEGKLQPDQAQNQFSDMRGERERGHAALRESENTFAGKLEDYKATITEQNNEVRQDHVDLHAYAKENLAKAEKSANVPEGEPSDDPQVKFHRTVVANIEDLAQSHHERASLKERGVQDAITEVHTVQSNAVERHQNEMDNLNLDKGGLTKEVIRDTSEDKVSPSENTTSAPKLSDFERKLQQPDAYARSDKEASQEQSL